MSETALISAIIPTYNRYEKTVRAIESVLQQTYKNCEIIVIDDGGTDGSFKLLKEKYRTNDQLVLLTQKHSGVSKARNYGIAKSKGEWIAFLDSDDFWHEDKLEKQLKALKENSEYQLCHSEEIWIRDGVRINPHKKHQKQVGDIFKQSVKLCAISISTVILKKKIFDEIGMFDETMPACEDYDFWLRVTANHPILFVNQYLTTKFGGHPDQLSKKYWGMDRFRIYALDKLIREKKLSEEQLFLTQTELKKKLKIFIKGCIKHNNQEYLAKFKSLTEHYLLEGTTNEI